MPDAVRIGEARARGKTEGVAIPDSVRDRHVYIIGRTRSGKSTLLLNMIVHDIAAGKGVCVIDPHGDLVESLLDYIPKERIDDTIYFNPDDKAHPIPLNIFDTSNQEAVSLLADDLVVTFRRLSDSWGDRMGGILSSAIKTLLRIPGSTFFDIQRLLRDARFRAEVAARLDFPPLIEFWNQDFARLPKDATQPLLSKMRAFSETPELYAMLCQPTSPLNFDNARRSSP